MRRRLLERLEDASAGAIAAMRDAERAEVEKRAQQLAGEKARAAQGEVEGPQETLKEQAEAHAKESGGGPQSRREVDGPSDRGDAEGD